MSDYFFIKNKNGNVIDIEHASNKPGTPLDAFTKKSTNNDNQLWEFVTDPSGSGYFFIKNKNGNVIDIERGNTTAGLADGMPLDAFTQKSAGVTQQSDNQLWLFMKDPAGSGYHFIVSRLDGNVIDIKGASNTPGTALVSFPLKPTNNDNQLWTVEGGAFPSPVSAVSAPAAGLRSNSNYKFFSNCNPLLGITIIIDVSQDIICQSNSGSTSGFSFQLNCYSPLHHELAYQQFVLGLLGTSLQYNIQGGVAGGAPLFNVGYASLASLSNPVLPAGYRLMIAFNTQSTLVSRAGFTVWDNFGNTVAEQTVLMSSIDNVPSPSVGSAPVVAFDVNLVGPENGESVVLSSGAGSITYINQVGNLQLVPLSQLPSCADTRGGTTETANSVYGVLPSFPNDTFKQSFNVTG